MPLRSLLIAIGTLFIQPIPGNCQIASSDDNAIRQLMAAFADARNAHQAEKLVEFYSDDAEWLSSAGIPVKGRDALMTMWRAQIIRVPENVQRTLQSIDIPSPNLALVRVETNYPSLGRHSETFVLVKISLVWHIQIHESY
jgi:uncharacterized protein (TIGR02246 family)